VTTQKESLSSVSACVIMPGVEYPVLIELNCDLAVTACKTGSDLLVFTMCDGGSCEFCNE
jgi:hypothetical protein